MVARLGGMNLWFAFLRKRSDGVWPKPFRPAHDLSRAISPSLSWIPIFLFAIRISASRGSTNSDATGPVGLCRATMFFFTTPQLNIRLGRFNYQVLLSRPGMDQIDYVNLLFFFKVNSII